MTKSQARPMYGFNWNHISMVFIFSVALSLFYGLHILVIIALALVATHFPQFRRPSLGLACLLSALLVERAGTSVLNQALNLIPFYIFNFGFIFLVDRFKTLRRHYLPIVAGLVLTLIATQYLSEYFFGTSKLATLLTMPIILNIWGYMNYVKVPLEGLSYLERVIWLRPFWFRWIVPLGSNLDVKRGLFQFTSVNAPLFRRYATISMAIVLALFCLENMVFNKTLTFVKVEWLPNILSIPLVSTQGFAAAFKLYPAGGEISDLQQSWIFLGLQCAAVVHFLLYIGAFSSTAISIGVLAGFDIPLHVQAFWRARTFSEFYLKTTYHYSYLLRTHLMPVFSRFRFGGLKGRAKQSLTIALSIFVASAVSLLFGRSHWLGQHVDLVTRLKMSLHQLQYPALVALVCALNAVFNRGERKVQATTFFPMILLNLLYFFIFQFTLIFGFQFLRTDTSTKLDFALVLLGALNPVNYFK